VPSTMGLRLGRCSSAPALLLLASLAVILGHAAHAQLELPRVLVIVGGDGVVEVSIAIYANQSSEDIIYIDLPVKPLPGSIVVSPVDVIPQLLPNDTLALLKPAGVSRIDISYIASINSSKGVLSTYIRYPQWAGNLTVRIHKNVIPITMPENLSSVRSFGDYLIIEMARNTTWDLEYLVAPQQPTQPTQAQQPAQQGVPQPQLWAGILVSASIGGAIAYLAIRSVRRRSASPEYLDTTDREILRVIEKLGEASARDIMDATNLPRTTLYRRLNRLVNMGIIGTRSRGGITYYYITKKL